MDKSKTVLYDWFTNRNNGRCNAIPAVGKTVVDEYYKTEDRPKGKSVSVTVSASSFVPKPFTPFQWEPQDTIPTIHERQIHLLGS